MLAMLALMAAVGEPTEPEEVEAKTSLRILTDEEAWREPGFRIGIGYAFGALDGGGEAPGGMLHSALVRLGARLDDDWSLLATLRYGVVPGAPPMLRFSGTLEPTLHIVDELTLSIGLGLGGIVHPDTGVPTPEPVDPLIASLTIPGTDPLLGACSGLGVSAIARADYVFLTGELFATGPSVQLDAQWTACAETLTRVDPDSGDPIELRQFWRHLGVSVAWVFWWR